MTPADGGRGLVVAGPGRIDLVRRPAPVPGPGEVLVRPVAVGVCHTDLDILDGRIDPDFVRYPLVIGHEWSGVVLDGGTAGPPAGTAVVVEGIVPCGHCRPCRAGSTNRCETYDEFGFVRDGAAADLVVAPAHLVHPLAPGVDAGSGALVEPAAVVLTALLRAAPRPGDRVLVVGDGTIGLLAARLAALWAPAELVMAGRRPQQAGLARAAGVHRFVLDPADVGAGYDLVVEAAGAVAAVATALAAPARGGTVALLGFPGQGVDVPLSPDDLVNGDLTLFGSFGYTSAAWARVVGLLNGADGAGGLDLSFLVTHRFALDEWAAALDALRHPDDSAPRAKVLLSV
jgi:2-desacetyl-2-hydroxyethyl bacteriochlorophyllide A dehydrogenase